MARLSYHPKNFETFIGLDVDKKSFSFTVHNRSEMNKSKKIPSNPEGLYNYIQKHFDPEKVICAHEAGPTGYHLYDYLKQKGILCLITAPASIPKARNQRVKNNRIDSVDIADNLMSGKLKPIRVPQGPYRELRELTKIREVYAHDRKVAKQRIKAVLLSAHLYPSLKEPEAHWSSRYIKELQEIKCSFAVRHRLDMLIEDFEHARRKLLSIHRTLRSFCCESDEINQYIHHLQSIPGVGFTVAVMLLGNIGDPQYLQNPREIASFVGLTPREKSTGDDVNRGSITHLGDKTMRSLLIEAAWVSIRHDTQLKQFFERVKSRNHPRIAANIAITAVARKLTQYCYRVLIDKRDFIQH